MASGCRGGGESPFERRGDRAEVIGRQWRARPHRARQPEVAEGVGERKGDFLFAAPLRECACELEESRIGEKIRRPRVRDAPDALHGFDQVGNVRHQSRPRIMHMMKRAHCECRSTGVILSGPSATSKQTEASVRPGASSSTPPCCGAPAWRLGSNRGLRRYPVPLGAVRRASTFPWSRRLDSKILRSTLGGGLV